jgi:hypothetical protein
MIESLKETVLHPVTVASSIVTAVLSTMWLPLDPGVLTALGGTLWAHSGTLFSAGSAMAFAGGWDAFSGLGWLKPIGMAIGASGALLFAAKKLDQFADDFQDRL